MSNKQYENRFDKWIRDAAGHYDLPFDEAHWHQMEQLLDKKKRRRRVFFFWLWGAAGVAMAITLWNFSSKEDAVTVVPGINTITAPAAGDASLTSSIKPSSERRLEPQSNQDSKADQPIQSITTAGTISGIASAPRRQVIAPSSQEATQPGEANEQNRYAIDVAVNKLQEINDESTVVAIERVSGDSIAQSPPDSVRNRAISIDSTVSPAAPAQKQQPDGFHRLEMVLLTTADLSKVGSNGLGKIDPGYGLGITYHINRRWSVFTGVALARKTYTTDSASYKNLDWQYPNSRINGIYANCEVIEIPLNIQYRLRQSGRNSFFASMGLSSYLMHSEWYRIDYLVYGEQRHRNYLYIKENQHFFAVAHLGLAYRRQLSPHWGMQLSPYAKIPLNGIGQGQSRLYSFGLQFSLHYSTWKTSRAK